MTVQKDQAVVVRLSDYSETSQIVSLFTRDHGLVRLIAKGSRRGTKKHFAPGLDLLEFGEASFALPRGDATLGNLTEWFQKDAFSGIRRDLDRLYGAYYALELIARLTEQYDPDPALFATLLQFLQSSADSLGKTAASIVHFQGLLLKAIGYAPVMRRCAHCGNTRIPGTRAYFSSAAGGMICRDCENAHPEKIRIASRMLDEPASAQDPLEWLDLLNYHLTNVAGREITTFRRLRSVLGGAGHSSEGRK